MEGWEDELHSSAGGRTNLARVSWLAKHDRGNLWSPDLEKLVTH